MKKYFEKYQTTAEYEAANNKWPHISYIEETEEVKYEEKPDYSTHYFTTVALSDGNIGFSGTNSNKLSYSKDEGQTWTAMTSNTVSLPVDEGDRVMWKGTPTPSSEYYRYGIGRFTSASTANFNVEGNAMSLLFGDNFQEQTDLTSKNYALAYIFSGNTHLVSAKNLVLPATTLADHCYSYMFDGCTSLTTAPQLPATTLASSCYSSMFVGCRSLTAAPQLPATTLAGYCYYFMFSDCTSLTTAPSVLPATTLADLCYQDMFNGCTSLTEAPKLPATTLADSCYKGMFDGCTSLTTAPELPATSLAGSCYWRMFRGTSITVAPELPATTLAVLCYREMFKGCTSLNSITCLATNISASECTEDWVSNVAAQGTFTKAASMTNWGTSASGIPNGWTVVDA